MATSFLVAQNRAFSKLAAAVNNSTTTFTVIAGQGANFPSTYPFHLTIEDEIVSVTNRSTDSLTVVRAQQGSSAAAHPVKAYIALHITAKSITDLNTAVNTLETYDVLTTRGDLIVRTASAPARLAKGADNTILAMGANDPEWKAPAAIMGDLSGQAAAAFDFNGQVVKNIAVLQVNGATAAAYSRIGAGDTGHSLDSANDLLVTGKLEVDALAYFDAAVDFAAAVTGISLSEIENLESDKTFTMAAKNLTYNFTTPSEGITLNVTGAFSDHLFHIHQLTGNPGVGTELIHLHTEDPDVLPIHLEHSGDDASYEAVEFELRRSSPTDGDNIIQGFHFWHDGALTSTAEVEFAKVTVKATDVSEDSEDASYTISLMKAGAMTDTLVVASTGITAAVDIAMGGKAITGHAQAITDNAVVTVDGSPNDDEYGRFTANGLEGRTLAETIADLLGTALPENTAVILDAALSADGKYSGIVEAGTAGAALAFGDLVYFDGVTGNNKWELTDADAEATAFGKLGICVQAANEDAETVILLWGKVRADSAFPALTIGAPVHVGETAGDIQVAAPTDSGDIVRIIGYGNTADELFFCPGNSTVELV